MGRHYFRLSLTREAEPLKVLSSVYHGLAVEAHILELYSNAVGTFLAVAKKPYFIDPALYRLCEPLFLDAKEKRWAAELVERYGLVEVIAENEDGLMAELFADGGKAPSNATSVGIDTLVGQVLDYERGRVPEVGAGQALWDQLEGGKSIVSAEDFVPPEFLVVPYLQVTDGQILDLNAKLAASAVKQKKKGEKIAAVAPIPTDYLTQKTSLDKVISTYAALDVDAILIWVADFREWDEELPLLEAFAHYISDFRKAAPKAEVINLYGSFFSTVLTGRSLLSASVQGVGISEHKDPFAIGGGGVPRYYVPISHQSVSSDFASDMRQLNPTLFSCPCPECSVGNLPSQMNAAALARHFIRTRSTELKWSSSNSAPDIVKSLNDSAGMLKTVKGAVAGVADAHARRLQVWAAVLAQLASDGTLS